MRQQKVSEEIRKSAGDFIALHAQRHSLITPTRVDISPDLTKATIYFTVLPESEEERALHFLRRKRSEFKQHLKRNHFKRLPLVNFQLDYGEKNRQLLDDIRVG